MRTPLRKGKIFPENETILEKKRIRKRWRENKLDTREVKSVWYLIRLTLLRLKLKNFRLHIPTDSTNARALLQCGWFSTLSLCVYSHFFTYLPRPSLLTRNDYGWQTVCYHRSIYKTVLLGKISTLRANLNWKFIQPEAIKVKIFWENFWMLMTDRNAVLLVFSFRNFISFFLTGFFFLSAHFMENKSFFLLNLPACLFAVKELLSKLYTNLELDFVVIVARVYFH